MRSLDNPAPSLDLSLDSLEVDPYPIYARLRREAPVCFVPSLGIWYVTRHEDVQAILRDTDHFRTGTPASLLFDTFQEHMLTIEGPEQERYKGAFRGAFSPKALRIAMRESIDAIVAGLIDDIAPRGGADLRETFARRLPILAMLRLFDLDPAHETDLREWYDDFETALSNFAWDESVRQRAHRSRDAFHALIQDAIVAARAGRNRGLLAALIASEDDDRLSDEEIRRNAGIIFFGGISTVEALTLNTLYALLTHPETMARVRADTALVPSAIEESLRWIAPVQSATRHLFGDVTIDGVTIPHGATVNCMLASANRDEAVFAHPERYDIDRKDVRRHLSFALGAHFCLGSHLARMEGITALEALLSAFPAMRLDPARETKVRGFEFRQPEALHVTW